MPNQNSNLVTAIEGSLTAWIKAVTIKWPVQAKFFTLRADNKI